MATYSHGHGWYLPPPRRSWSIADLETHVDLPHPMGQDNRGLSWAAIQDVSSALDKVDRQALAGILRQVPAEWPVSDRELKRWAGSWSVALPRWRRGCDNRSWQRRMIDMRYIYSMVRFVPNPASGEFVNVGAIAGSDDAGDWAVRQVSNPARARSLGPFRVVAN